MHRDFRFALFKCKIQELMHRHCGTNNIAPRWTFTDPCKPEMRPGAREESASSAWLAAPAMNVNMMAASVQQEAASAVTSVDI